MIEFIKKTTKIMDEVTSFFMANGSTEISIKVSNKGNYTSVTFEVEDSKLSIGELDEIEDSLSIPRQEDVEEYYWQLNGADETESEFDLIGMMIDSYTLEVSGSKLRLELFRKK
jgi:hypothetical protein